MGEPATVTTEIRDHIVLLGLNRPHKRNAFNLQMLRELAEHVTAYETEAHLRCAVLFAHGEHFTGGLDLAEVGPAVQSGARLFPEGLVDPLDLVEPRRSKPLICAVQGWCLTIGVELLLAADIRLAARGTRLAQMEVQRGILPFGGATLRLPQVAGWGNAMRYLLTGNAFTADEALRIGVVQEVVAPEHLLPRASELAHVVARQAPLAVRESLRSARLAVEQGPQAAAALLMDQARAVMSSEDAREGLQSFVERREARFLGR